MKRDIRETALYREAEGLYRSLRQPGTGQVSDAAEIHASPDGKSAVYSGAIMHSLEGAPPTRICLTDLTTGDTRVLTHGPAVDRAPKFSPDGRRVAFLSDRHRAGDFQLYLLDLSSGVAVATPSVRGWVEYLHWSPDGRRILLGVAGHGADVSGGQGAVTTRQMAEGGSSWMPTVEMGDEEYRWRRVWVYDCATSRTQQVKQAEINIWEAVWCGNDAIAAVGSSGPAEGLWYTASLYLLTLGTGNTRVIYVPKDQIGWPAANASGTQLAFVEASCSDRGLVAGDLRLMDLPSGGSELVDTAGVDVAHLEWRSGRELLIAGHRGFDTVVAVYQIPRRRFAERWCSRELTTAGFYVTVSGLNEPGDCVMVAESFTRAPEIGVVRGGEYRSVKSFDLDCAEHVKAIGNVEPVIWQAPDGLELQGWLLQPKSARPHPVIMNIHGGPVWQWRPMWLGRARISTLMLLRRGYAQFFPNPRGSSGRGQEFARRVLGDVGGADAGDCLSGLDHLVDRGIADPGKQGVTGVSYGGYMTSWLITQDSRFAAAVSLAQISNHVTSQLLSNIPEYVVLSLQDRYTNAGGKYFQRSPIMHAHKTTTPTLNICGALDRCTPPEETVQFHHALLDNGVRSILVTYPEEGHGIRKLPAAIDCTARMVAWFEEHIPVGVKS